MTVKLIQFTVPLVVVADVRVVVAAVDAVVELAEMVELGDVDEMAGVVAVVISTTIYSRNREAHQCVYSVLIVMQKFLTPTII
jgi:hypothetical protein